MGGHERGFSVGHAVRFIGGYNMRARGGVWGWGQIRRGRGGPPAALAALLVQAVGDDGLGDVIDLK